MKSPELGEMSPEQSNKESTTVEELLKNLHDLSFLENSGQEICAEDLESWNDVSEFLSKKIFVNLDQFMNDVKVELDKKEWVDKNTPTSIIEKIDDLIDLVQWKQKNNNK